MYILMALVIIIFIMIVLARSKKITPPESLESTKPPKVVSRSGMKDAKYCVNTFCTSSAINQKHNDSSHIGKDLFENLESDTFTSAAKAGHEAKQVVKDKDYNKAWGLLSEQKSLYMKHSQALGFSALNTLSLDSNVHENYGSCEF